MSNVSKNQIAHAKQTDLLTYLQTYEPDSIFASGNSTYRLKEHDSFVISNGKWHWFSRGIGGKSALDFLIHVRGMEFVDAVQVLSDGHAAPVLSSQPVLTKVKKPFTLPKANRCGFHAVAYLQKRGIDNDIILRCISEGRFYESVKYRNCVFVGFDTENIPRYAWLRGITTGFRQDVEGSDKRYGFVLQSSNSRCVAVFESPIDALSLASLRKMESGDLDDTSYLSLGGTSPLALLQYLKDHPHTDNICLCLDNDKAGLDAVEKIKEAVYTDKDLQQRAITFTVEPPNGYKDYNEVLLAKLEHTPRRSRRQAVISI